MAQTGAGLIFDLTQTDLPPGTEVYFYVVGLVAAASGNQYYYLDQNFMPQLMAGTDNTEAAGTFPGMNALPQAAQTALAVNYPLAWADWSIKVAVGSNLVVNLGNINTTNIPSLGTGTSAFSGRIYCSVGVPRLPFTVQSSGGSVSGYTAPVFGNGTGVGGSMTLFDWIEFSYDSGGNFNGNTTQVDQFGFPLYLQGQTASSATPVQGVLNQSRADIFSTLGALPAPFAASNTLVAVAPETEVAYPANTGYLRALAPDLVSQANDSLASYFDATVTAAYQAWQATPLVTTDPSTGAYSGVVFPVAGNVITPPAGYATGSIAFYQGSYPTLAALQGNTGSFAFCLTGGSNVITSDDIWQCGGSLANGGDAQKNVGKTIAAGLNRGIVVSPSGTVATQLTDMNCSGQAGSFYPTGATFNPWAQLWHQFNANGLAYGFAYDDVCDQATSIPSQGNTLVATWIRVAVGTFFTAGSTYAGTQSGEEALAPAAA